MAGVLWWNKEGCSFLKKEPKNIYLFRVAPGLPRMDWGIGEMCKSFLLLFSKKEDLSFSA
jgi:hypothetical protein